MENNTAQVAPVQAVKKLIKANVKTAIIVATIIALGALGYVFKGFFIAATVDGSPISRLAVVQRLEKASGKDLLDSLVIERLIQNEAKAKKIVVSDEEINGEIKKIEDQIAAQGGTLGSALLAQGMSMDELKRQLTLQKEVERLVADKINVTDEEVAKYIIDNAIPVIKGQEAVTDDQVRSDLRNQKLNQEASILIITLKSEAKIRYFVNY